MKSKLQLMAEEVMSYEPLVVVDIGYAQVPNMFFTGTTLYGVDIIAAQPVEGYDKTFTCDLNTTILPFADSSVSAVAMGCTLAHVANPLMVLSEINRVLKDDGVCVLSSPNPNYYWETVLNVFYHKFKERVSKAKHLEHFFEFSRYNMRTIAGRTGFEVIKEAGVAFQLVKTSFKCNPIRFPGLAYEIMYTLRKVGNPTSYATYEDVEGIHEIPTNLFGLAKPK